MAHYDHKLLKEASAGSLTAARIGQIVGCYSADALTRLRVRKDIPVTIVGKLPPDGSGPPRKLYKIEKVIPVSGAYCCGYCEQQRQLDKEDDRYR
jgi:hypothetical protein